MEFECKTIPIYKMNVFDGKGPVEPICNRCIQAECSNPIRKKKISLFGKTNEWYVFMSGNQAYQVVECTGFLE